MASVLFQITMGTGLALAVDKNNPDPGGELVVEHPRPTDPDQQWTWAFMPGTQASALFNPARNLFAAPESLNEGAPVVLYAPNMPLDGNNTWQVLGSDGAAVRPPANADLNLNVFGDEWPVGSRVGIYTWSGGEPNEVWTSRIIAT